MKQTIKINAEVTNVFDAIMKAAMSEMRIKGQTGVSYKTLKGMRYRQKVNGPQNSRHEVDCVITEFDVNERYFYELRDDIRGIVHHVRYTFYPINEQTKIIYEEYSEKNGKHSILGDLLAKVLYRKQYKDKLNRLKLHIESELEKGS